MMVNSNSLLCCILLSIITITYQSSTPIWSFEKYAVKINDPIVYTSIATFENESIKTYTVNDINYLEIGNKAIPIDFEKLDSFVKLNSIYYICQKGTGKINVRQYNPSNNKITELSQPTFSTTPDKWSLNCFYTRVTIESTINNAEDISDSTNTVVSSKFFFVTFLGTQSVFAYFPNNSEDNKWKEILHLNYKIFFSMLDQQLKTNNNLYYWLYLTVYDPSQYNHSYKYIITTKNPNEITLTLESSVWGIKVMIYEQFSSYYSYVKDGGLTEYVISYDDNNSFSQGMGLIDLTNGNCYCGNDARTALPLTIEGETYTINEMYFLSSSYYYYSVTTSSGETFWGVVEAYSNLVVFNSNYPVKRVTESVDSAILHIETYDNEMFELCYLAYDDNGVCKDCSSSTTQLVINPNGQTLCRTRGENAPKIFLCTNNEIFDLANGACSSCGIDSTFLLLPDDICINQCDSTRHAIDTANSQCTACYKNNEYLKIGETSCTSSIPDGWFISNVTYNVIEECSSECQTCYATPNSTSTNCLTCRDTTKYVKRGNCVDVSECDGYTYINAQTQTCEICKENQYKYYGTTEPCQTKPESTVVINDEYHIIADCYSDCLTCSLVGDADNGHCTSCKANYLYQENCVTSCPNYFLSDSSHKKCVNCADDNLVRYESDSTCRDPSTLSGFYYLLEQFGIIANCYSLCNSCYGPGNSTFHNCKYCRQGYRDDPSNTNNCIPICPNTLEGVYQGQCINCKTEHLVRYEDNPHCVDIPNEEYEIINEEYAIIRLFNMIPDLATLQSIIDSEVLSFFNRNNEIVTQEYTLEVYDTSIHHTSPSNTSSIDMGKCEVLLRNKYKIFLPERLVIYKLDIKTSNEYLTNRVQYAVFAPNGTKLELDVCDEVGIKVEVPIKEDVLANLTLISMLTEEGVDVSNKSDPFFNDICVKFKSDDSPGLPFNMRKDLYVNNSLCSDGCKLQSIDVTTRKANCECKTVYNVLSLSGVRSNFKDTILNSNFFVLRCYKQVFNAENLKVNAGSYIFLSLLFLQICTSIYYAYTSIFPLKVMIMGIIEKKGMANPPKKVKISKSTTIKSSNYDSESNIDITKNSREIIIKGRKFYQMNSMDQSSINDEEDEKPSTKALNNNYASPSVKNLIPQKLCMQDRNILKTDTSIQNEDKNKDLIFTTTTTMRGNSPYTPEELNNLPFEFAVQHDKRKFCELYWEYLKYKHPLLNAFILDTDSNLKSVKISMLILTTAMSFAFNALFFTEDIQEENYNSNGNLSFIVTLPKVIISCLASVFISTFLTLLSSFHSKLQKLRESPNSETLNINIGIVLKSTKCKLHTYFVIVLLLMLFFWYFAAAFCAVIPKYETLWIVDSCKSLVINMIFPFFFALGIALFRYIAIRKNSRCCFCFAKIINIV